MDVATKRGVESVAIYEAIKGALVLLAGFGILSLLGRDGKHLAEEIVRRLHLDPTRHYPEIFIHAMSDLNNAKLWRAAAFAGAYSLIRFVEAFGLWREKAWAEWLAVLSGGLYLPVEIYEIFRHPTWFKYAMFLLNLAMVAFMTRVLILNSRAREAKKLLAD